MSEGGVMDGQGTMAADRQRSNAAHVAPADRRQPVALCPRGGGVVPYEPDPRLAAIADRLEGQVAQADELVSAFRGRAVAALNEAGPLPIGHISRNGLLDSASRLASTVARLMQATAAAADTIQRLRGGGAVQRIVVERAVIMAGGRGEGVARDD